MFSNKKLYILWYIVSTPAYGFIKLISQKRFRLPKSILIPKTIQIDSVVSAFTTCNKLFFSTFSLCKLIIKLKSNKLYNIDRFWNHTKKTRSLGYLRLGHRANRVIVSLLICVKIGSRGIPVKTGPSMFWSGFQIWLELQHLYTSTTIAVGTMIRMSYSAVRGTFT